LFYKFHICFFLNVLKKIKHTARIGGGIKTLNHNVRTKLRLAYHGFKNLTHTSKTLQVKRIQMVATAMLTISAFVTFSDC